MKKGYCMYDYNIKKNTYFSKEIPNFSVFSSYCKLPLDDDEGRETSFPLSATFLLRNEIKQMRPQGTHNLAE